MRRREFIAALGGAAAWWWGGRLRQRGDRMRRPTFIVTLVVALIAGVGLWWYKYFVPDAFLTKDTDLSELFQSGPNQTMGPGDFVDLPDPGCTKSFSLQLQQPAFIRMSRNCSYSMYVDLGRVRANFLNPNKGSVELSPGHNWVASDFWSITPLAASAAVRLEPTR
jgi:hypothetical protein